MMTLYVNLEVHDLSELDWNRDIGGNRLSFTR